MLQAITRQILKWVATMFLWHVVKIGCTALLGCEYCTPKPRSVMELLAGFTRQSSPWCAIVTTVLYHVTQAEQHMWIGAGFVVTASLLGWIADIALPT